MKLNASLIRTSTRCQPYRMSTGCVPEGIRACLQALTGFVVGGVRFLEGIHPLSLEIDMRGQQLVAFVTMSDDLFLPVVQVGVDDFHSVVSVVIGYTYL